MFDLPSPGRVARALYQLAPSVRPWPPFPPQGDALSDPALDDIAASLAGLLPTGGAWRSPDAAAFDWNSLLGGFLRGLAGIFVTLYRRVFQVSQESTASTLVDGLDDWEREFGLPDPCFGEDQNRTQRMRALLLKIRSAGTITPADFINLAASVGYTISIREPRPFTTGFSRTGWEDGTGAAIAYFWIVRPTGAASKRFETGVSRTGVNSLLDIAHLTDLECLFRALAPAWTRVIFDYS